MHSLPLFLIVLAIPLGVSAAQQDVPRPWSAPDSVTLSRLHAKVQGRRRVRIVRSTPTAPYSRPVEVAYPTLSRTGIREADGPEVTPWADVSRVQVRGSAVPPVFLVGSIVGGTAGLIVGLASTGHCDGDFIELCEIPGWGIPVMTLFGAALLGALSALVATPFGRWSTVYQAQPQAPGRRVRATAPTHFQGRKQGVLRPSGVIEVPGGEGGPLAVPLADVTRLEYVGRESAWWVGARWGALLGLVGGTVGGLVFCGEESWDPFTDMYGCTPSAGAVVSAGALGLVAGGALGAAVGSFFDHDAWRETPLDQIKVAVRPLRDGVAFGARIAF